LIQRDSTDGKHYAKLVLRRPARADAATPGPAATWLPPCVVGGDPFCFDPRMTRDQWVLILVCALAATLFAAILLCHPS
jgi:hypothetical protein